jgi:hypothetical protein
VNPQNFEMKDQKMFGTQSSVDAMNNMSAVLCRLSTFLALIIVVFSLAHVYRNVREANQENAVPSSTLKSLGQVHGATCKTEINGSVVRMSPGEKRLVAKQWLNCEMYDGHPVIIHSGTSPAIQLQSADTASPQ